MGAHLAPGRARRRRNPVATGLTIAIVVVAALAALGAVAMWPRGDPPDLGIQPQTYVDATVADSHRDTCPSMETMGPDDRLDDCTIYTAELTSGPESGQSITFQAPVTRLDIPELDPGDEVVLLDVPTSPLRYSFIDYQRSTPLLWLLVVFVVAVVAFGRWQGLRALAGLGMSLLVLVLFIVPALLHGSPELLVALVGAAMVAFLAVYLAHGVGMTSSIALAGTLSSLAITALLAAAVASLTHLSGLVGSDEAQTLRVTAAALDLRGLLVAGIVIGALGVLDDVTVSQVSTVAALRRANPALTSRQLYGEATRVGRDHVAAAVNTLVLAYAGASLPLLLLFSQGSQPIARLLTGEVVAVEIVRMLVGSVGLILSVPVTTALAAAILTRTDAPPDDGHGHAHGHRHAPDLPPSAVPTIPASGDPGTRQENGPATGAEEPVRPWF